MSSTSSSARSSQTSISPFFKRSIQYDNTSKRKTELDKALLQMICTDYQPFTIVEDKGFKNFISLLDPRYILPCPNTVANKLLKEEYLEKYQKLKNELNATDFVSITCDLWTSRITESYLTVTCHFIKDWKIQNKVLSTKPLENGINHTAENIANSLKSILEEWNICNKVTCIVTDNASSMIKACELLQKRHMPCFAYTINLVVQDNLHVVEGVLKKVKIVITFFKQSTVASNTLKNEQTEKSLKLIQECPTRWNSTLYMIQRVLELSEPLGRALLKLRNAPTPLTVEDYAILKDISMLLQCFEEATQKVSGKAELMVLQISTTII